MKHRFLLAIALILSMAGSLVAAQGSAPSSTQSQIAMHQLTPAVYWAEGGVSNSGIIIGDSGVIVVDAKMTTAAAKEMLDDIAKITPKPVVAVILTHSDGDHIGGLPAFPEGIQIVAHRNCALEMQQPQGMPGGVPGGGQGGGPGGPPHGGPGGAANNQGADAAPRMPNRIVSRNREEMTIAGVHLVLLHWAPAHTSGDLVVYLPDRKIVFAGDILTENAFPLIHLQKHGSSEGWITTANGIAALDADRIVPGHGNVTDTASIRKLAAESAAKREKIKELAAQGKTLAEIKAALNDPAPAPAVGHPVFPTFTEVVYRELTSKKSD